MEKRQINKVTLFRGVLHLERAEDTQNYITQIFQEFELLW